MPNYSASTTFLSAVNELLVELNEVPLTSTDFSTAYGIQAFAKDAIRRAEAEVHTDEARWPWMANTGVTQSTASTPYGNSTFETVAGQRYYLIPSDIADIDWEHFRITTRGVTDETSPYTDQSLYPITFHDWMTNFMEDEDDDRNSDNPQYGIPRRVFRSKDVNYIGFSPTPDKVYKVYYYSWISYTPISSTASYDTVLTIPDKFLHLVLNKARFYLWTLKENKDLAMMYLEKSQKDQEKVSAEIFQANPPVMTSIKYGGW